MTPCCTQLSGIRMQLSDTILAAATADKLPAFSAAVARQLACTIMAREAQAAHTDQVAAGLACTTTARQIQVALGVDS